MEGDGEGGGGVEGEEDEAGEDEAGEGDEDGDAEEEEEEEGVLDVVSGELSSMADARRSRAQREENEVLARAGVVDVARLPFGLDTHYETDGGLCLPAPPCLVPVVRGVLCERVRECGGCMAACGDQAQQSRTGKRDCAQEIPKQSTQKNGRKLGPEGRTGVQARERVSTSSRLFLLRARENSLACMTQCTCHVCVGWARVYGV